MHRLKNTKNFSKPQLLVFALIFALIGYLIFRSFALNPNLPGDLNNDNTVNITDLSILLSDYGTTDPTKIAQADINSDGTVNVLDMSILLSHYGQSVSSFTTNITQNQTITTPFTWTFNPGVATTAGYFFADGVQLAKITGPGPYSFTIQSTTLTSGTHTLGGSWDLASDGSHVVFPQTYTVTINNGTSGGGTLGSKLPARLPQSTGTTYYVDGTNGNDANNGSSSAPWKTINHALNTVPLSGSIIRVRAGTYYGVYTSYPIQFSRAGDVNNPVTLMADKPGTVTIANGDLTRPTIGAWIIKGSGLRIQDFIFRVVTNPGVGQWASEVLVENSDRVELYHNTFNEVGVISVTCRGGALTSGQTADDMWVLDNTFRPSGSNVYAQVTGLSYTNQQYFGTKGSHWIYGGQYGQDPTDGNWNYTNGCRRMVVANNVFVGAAAGRDIEFGPQERDSFIVNNTFYGNQSVPTIGMGAGPGTDACPCYAGQGLALYGNTGTTTYETGNNVITNNIFMDMYGHAVSGSGSAESGNLVQNNLSYKLTNGAGYDGPTNVDYYPTSNPLFSTGTGNLSSADPLFNNALGFDYTLKVGSPAIGKADPAYTFPYDITGKARDSAPDLGAYEF